MALSITHDEAHRLPRALARETGPRPVVTALRERLDRIRRHGRVKRLLAEIGARKRRVAKLPVAEARSADAIIGYDEYGPPR